MPDEFLTPLEISKILKVSPEFVYKHAKEFGGVKIGRLVRFSKRIFNQIMEEVMKNGRETRHGMEIRFHEERGEVPAGRISHKGRRSGSGGQSEDIGPDDKYGLYKIVQQSVKGRGTEEE
jgi:hypothetical protein